MAKRKITLTSQEMNQINARTETLEAQLGRSNARVEELETALNELKTIVSEKPSAKQLDAYFDTLAQLIQAAIIPPVLAKVARELEEALATS